MAKGEKWALIGFLVVILLIALAVYLKKPETVEQQSQISGFVMEKEGETLQPATLTVAGKLTRTKLVHTPQRYQGKFTIDKLSVTEEIDNTVGFGIFYSEEFQAYHGVCFLEEQEAAVRIITDKSFSKFICIYKESIAIFPADTVAEAEQICEDLNMQWIPDRIVHE